MRTTARPLTAVVFLAALLLTAGTAAQETPKGLGEEEATAVGCLRTINTAEVAYAATYKSGYSPTLAALGMKPGWKGPTPKAAGLIDEELTAGKMDGYMFAYRPGKPEKALINTYTVTACPIERRKGLRSFFSDQTGVIRWTAESRPATARDPKIE
jgi:type IV pilus assembly protein PilA